MQLMISWSKSGVATYRWTPHSQKLGMSGHCGHQWIDSDSYGILYCFVDVAGYWMNTLPIFNAVVEAE